MVLLWGWPAWKTVLNGGTAEAAESAWPASAECLIAVPGLHNAVYRTAPVVEVPPGADRGRKAREGRLRFQLALDHGHGHLPGGRAVGLLAADRPARSSGASSARTLFRVRWALLTIACMLALAFVTKYSGADATLGLAFTHTGWLYPFFAPLLGWLGVALTGSDTSSNALFGSLQRITAEQLGLNPVLIVASNSTGGVMGKMIDAQSIVVAAVATEQSGGEGRILRFVFLHSIVLACLVGLLTLVQAYLCRG